MAGLGGTTSQWSQVPGSCFVKASIRLADIEAVKRLLLLSNIGLALSVAACNGNEAPTPAGASPSPPLLSNCTEASSHRLPYSFCVPDTWRVFDVVHSDGSIDIAMLDETGEVLGSGSATGPVEPSGRLNRYVPFPQVPISGKERQRFLTDVGFEPKVARDLSIGAFPVDGQPGSLMTLTLDMGDPEAITRVFDFRMPVEDGGGIRLLFVFGAAKGTDEIVRGVLSTVRIDASLVKALVQSATAGTGLLS